MKSVLVSLVLAVACAATVDAAGVNFAANTCWGAGGVATASFDCNSNTGTTVLYTSVVLPVSLPQFVGVGLLVDVDVAGATLPAWWLTGSGECRFGGLTEDYRAITMDGACPDIWEGNAALSVVTIQNGIGGPNRLRINGGAALPIENTLSLVADGTTELNVARVLVSHAHSVGATACEGCNAAACFQLVELKLYQPAGVGDYTLPGATSGGNWLVAWNGGGVGPCPGVVPARNRTWGAVKSLYR